MIFSMYNMLLKFENSICFHRPLHIAVAQENIVMVQKFVHLMTISGKNVDKYNKSLQVGYAEKCIVD